MPRTPYLLASVALIGGLTAGGAAASELASGRSTVGRSLELPAPAGERPPSELAYADSAGDSSALSAALGDLRYVPVTATIPPTTTTTTTTPPPTTTAPPPVTTPPSTEASVPQPEPPTTAAPEPEPEPAPAPAPAPSPAPVPAPPAVAGGIDADAEWAFLALTNQARAAVGVPGLTMDASLQAYARYHAQEMAASGHIYHSDISSLLGAWSTVGENVGVGPSVGAIQNALLASPGHYENLSDGGFGSVGIGVFVDASGRVWTAHVFGA